MLSVAAVRSLRHLRLSEIAAILDSCAKMSWQDETLLCGLSEAVRCSAELRKGTVRDYSSCCHSLRRLQYCPWVGALRPLVAELRNRLQQQRWRSSDIALTLRFASEFGLHQLPHVRQGAALCAELQRMGESRIGAMLPSDLAHFARGIATF
eukprot:968313-Amphidinium_carterae.1